MTEENIDLSQYNETVLFVDDEPFVLNGIKRQLYNKLNIITANSGLEALEIVKSNSNIAIIVSDYKMPEMNGIQLLSKVREKHPNIIRIILTGNCDLEAAITAINKSNIFRIIMKPSSVDDLVSVLSDGFKQYKLQQAEKELLEITLLESINTLSDILSLMNPVAFNRAKRLQHYVNQISELWGLKDAWWLNMSATLSQIGCVSIPPEIITTINSGYDVSPEEQKIYDSYLDVSASLIKAIPRLEKVAAVISKMKEAIYLDISEASAITIGAHILHVANKFDDLINKGMSRSDIIKSFEDQGNKYHHKVLNALTKVELYKTVQHEITIDIDTIQLGMHLASDLVTKKGNVLARQGDKVSSALFAMIYNYNKQDMLYKTILVYEE
ncbi:MAG: hypothetical protein A2Y40_04985 [Candidatus Margulisbacteria bacterium GWF2_35_9]|nr:MAG: hypothetical protein A2Y40_04985 [Candidatus Margulisbacteria bacterium GWF2_35_9]